MYGIILLFAKLKDLNPDLLIPNLGLCKYPTYPFPQNNCNSIWASTLRKVPASFICTTSCK